MSDELAPDTFATITHARIRAAQGDVAGARRILRAALSKRPGDPEATALFESLSPRREKEAKAGAEETLQTPEPGDPSDAR